MSETSEQGIRPMSQKQEDLLLELFLQLSVEDRKVVIRQCRDLLRASQETQKDS